MTENIKSQKGLTLVEVLVSIVLLTIILTSFMGFITQSALFTKKNEQKLNTMQTAQIVVNMVEDEVTKDDLLFSGIINESWTINPNSGSSYKISTKDEFNTLFNTDLETDYLVSLDISNKLISTPNQTPDKLVQFKIIVEDPNNSGSKSITYTYFRK